MKQRLAQELQELTSNLRRQQKEHYIRIKEINGENDFLEEKKDDFLNDDVSMMEMEQDPEEDLMRKERDREINNLVQSINDLAVLFKELSTLVID